MGEKFTLPMVLSLLLAGFEMSFFSLLLQRHGQKSYQQWSSHVKKNIVCAVRCKIVKLVLTQIQDQEPKKIISR